MNPAETFLELIRSTAVKANKQPNPVLAVLKGITKTNKIPFITPTKELNLAHSLKTEFSTKYLVKEPLPPGMVSTHLILVPIWPT